MDDLDGKPNPVEDLKHAHMLLAQMTPEELLKATYALEEIIEDSPRFREKMRKLDEASANGPWVPMEEVLADFGLTMKDLEDGARSPAEEHEAA